MIAPKPTSPPQTIQPKVVLEKVPVAPFVPEVPKVEDIQPTITQQEDPMFDWFFERSSTPDIFPEIPLSLGSPDSGLGTELIGSEPESLNSDQDLMEAFGSDISDMKTLSPISESMDMNSDDLFSDLFAI